MAKQAIVVLRQTTIDLKYDKAFDYIGVDKGASILLEKKIPMALAIGDFDSINQQMYDSLLNSDVKLVKLNPIKDDSDCEAAISYLKNQYDKLYILGATGGRLDHFLANYKLLEYCDEQLVLVDEQNIIKRLKKGRHLVEGENQYISFFTDQETIITLKGFKYPLTKRLIDQKTIYCLSNELVDSEGEIIIDKGQVVMFQSWDKKK